MLSFTDIQNQLTSFLKQTELPKYDDFVDLCSEVISVLEKEDSSYRPFSASGKSGGLLDFNSEKYSEIPVVVVPDLHARGYFLLDFLKYEIEGRSILSLLVEQKIIVCCVGDIFHSEGRERDRWIYAYDDFKAYRENNDISLFLNSDFMKSEMSENLNLLQMILFLKKTFPEHFHILKGNHENVKNATFSSENREYGNRAFRKFCEEGLMVTEYIHSFYDDLFLHYISCFEKTLPVCAVFKNCVVSHAEPNRIFSREEIIEGLSSDEVVFGLTWTANDVAQNGTVEKTIKNLYKKNIFDVLFNKTKKVVWIGGHRPVFGKYHIRQEGNYIQIHNPEDEQIALVRPNKVFNPESDIFVL